MPFNKSIALEEAARLVVQRKLAQAIRQYLAIAAEDPGDFTLLNTIGDLCVRDGNIPEALRQFYKLAEHYEREGFVLRAIAIYKKISKLDTSSADALVKLGDLYKSQGLGHEAREQYAQALAICHRNGLPDKALQILNQLIAHEPDNAGYRAQLAESCEAAGKSREAFEHYVQAASLAYRHRNLALAEAALRQAAQVDPNHPEVLLLKEQLAMEQEPAGLSETAVESFPALDQETPADPVEPAVEAEPREEIPSPLEETRPETGPPEISSSPGSVEIDFSAEWQAFAPAPPPPQVSAIETDWEEELAEIRFYLDHGFSSEALRTLGTLEEKYPGHPELAELRRRAEEAEVAAATPPEPELPPSTREQEPDFALDGGGGPQAAAEEPVRETESGFTPARLAESEAASLAQEHPSPEFSEAPQQKSMLAASRESSLPEEPVEEKSVPLVKQAPPERAVRKDVAIQGGVGAPERVERVLPSSPPPGTLSAGNESDIMSPLFEGILKELESDPEVDPSRETPQAHYNLGVAFREMGLAEEAIGEFQKAVKGAGPGNCPPHFVDACSLLGLCFMEKRMPGIAVRWFLRALGAPGLDEETHLGLTYDLALAYEESGNFEAALERFSEIYSVNIDYREIADKVRALQQKCP
ncbi:MAG TPA: tetratricopeptide repeat protein [Terriglobia bacterium]|nr:tetratricopeptide repeat protein [Terriglobia bacterium]